MAEATQTITFKTELSEGEAGEILTMDLDSEMNNDKTVFAFTTGICYFRVFSSVEYAISESHGDTTLVNPDVRTSVTETITFSGKDTGSVGSPIASITSYSFSGDGNVGSISVEDRKTIKNSLGNLLGTLTITYETAFDRWTLSSVPKPAGYDDEEDPGLNVIVLARSSAAGGE